MFFPVNIFLEEKQKHVDILLDFFLEMKRKEENWTMVSWQKNGANKS